MKTYSFCVLVYSGGQQVLTNVPTKVDSDYLGLILSHFHSVDQLIWFKNEIIKAKEIGEKTYTGSDTFNCFVTGNNCEIFSDNRQDKIIKFNTNDVIEFIEQATEFRRKYDCCEIPGIIPQSRKEDFVILPKSSLSGQS